MLMCSVASTQTRSLPCCLEGVPPGPVTRGDSRPRLCAWLESLPAAPRRSHSERAQFITVTGPFLKHYFLVYINESGLSNKATNQMSYSAFNSKEAKVGKNVSLKTIWPNIWKVA